MERIVISPQSIFIGPGYVQQAGAGLNCTRCLRYKTYGIPEGSSLRDVISYAYDRSFRRRGDINTPEISQQ